MKNSKLKFFLLALVTCFIVAYVVWAVIITVNNFNVPLTYWQHFMIFKNPILYCCIPALLIYIIYIILIVKEK